jgi:hypothetical protein
VALDEGVFQDQRLKLAGDEDRVEMIHLGHHGPGLFRVGGGVLKILADAVFQLFRLAHIDHPAGLVHHQIDARRQRQGVGLLAQLLARHLLFPSFYGVRHRAGPPPTQYTKKSGSAQCGTACGARNDLFAEIVA